MFLHVIVNLSVLKCSNRSSASGASWMKKRIVSFGLIDAVGYFGVRIRDGIGKEKVCRVINNTEKIPPDIVPLDCRDTITLKSRGPRVSEVTRRLYEGVCVRSHRGGTT